MKRRDWGMGTALKGSWVHLYELDRRARVWSLIEEKVCFCGLLRNEWMFKIPVGKPVYTTDDDGRWLENSLGSFLYDVENKISTHAWKTLERCEVMKVDITSEQAKVLWPEWASLIDELGD